jgi:beta-1,4-N-acetylglucosaminyltransferase
MVFVTVGTTCFDALVKTVDSEQVKEALRQKGYTHLVIQMGGGTYIPSKVTFFSTLFGFSKMQMVFITPT